MESALEQIVVKGGELGGDDARHLQEMVCEIGAEIESEAREYAYSLGYYAVFFYDPDGIKLEIVHVPRHAA